MPARCHLAFFGSSLVSAYWNGAATYYRGLIRALHAQGVQVTFYEPDAYDRQAHRDLPPPDWARSVVYPATEDGVAGALDDAQHADLLVKTSGVGVFDTFLERAVPDLAPGRALFWDVDAPATLARVAGDPTDPFRAQIARYALVLTYGGGPPVIRAYEGLGAARCVPIYNAVDPETHHPAAPAARFLGRLGLLANRLPDREARIEQFFPAPAARMPEATFVLGGSGWDSRATPPNVRRVGHVYTADHNAFNASSLAVLNVNRSDMAAVGYSPPTRIFEAAGAGACVVSDEWTGLEQFLEPGAEVLAAADGDAVLEHVRGLTPARAAAIGDRARRRVLAEHTYAQRATQLMEVLGLRPRVREAAG